MQARAHTLPVGRRQNHRRQFLDEADDQAPAMAPNGLLKLDRPENEEALVAAYKGGSDEYSGK